MMMSLSDITPIYILWGIVDIRYINYGTWLSTVGVLAWFTRVFLALYKKEKY